MKQAILHLKQADPVLAEIIGRVGEYRIQFREPEFATLVRSIVYQQLSGRVAAVIHGRLEAALAGSVTPAGILKLRPQRMRKLGLSAAKTAYIRDLARHTRDGSVIFEDLPDLPDQEVIERLTRVKGIGVWTAQMFLIFSLGRLDVFPHDDLGVRSAIRNLYGLDELPNKEVSHRIATPWRPYASVASWYCWRSLEFKDRRKKAG